ncbi:TRAP transporter permease [Pseudooceanicola spongiae]|uniref:TRAP transporter fused permease subunit n=1 Tax=Pseudooceanicola spongiae TaxID=2613965 RepID=A0A7L9WPM9_9RHOB|nr:TRAP transporter fused permease subunit [Pseudooceanicola spongiae]QOL81386.1 TRAP transporter fused permease subunit [Pseudooceanicola spongiae]
MTVSPLRRSAALYASLLCLVTPGLAIVWVLSLPQRVGLLVYPEQIAGVMLGAAMSVIFLKGIEEKSRLAAGLDAALAVLGSGLALWVFLRFPVLAEGQYTHPVETALLGLLVTALVLEGLRRAVGWTLVVIFAAVLAYALFADHAPQAIVGRPIPFLEVMQFLGADSTATWGQALQIAAFIVVVFVLFGGVLIAVGGGDFFTQLALKAAGNGPGNAAKVAVGASALMGSVSGSAVSNVMSTGVMTIPLMKRAGFRPEQAGAIEAVASTGGQLMPPIMGAAAFLMAEILQVPYREILIAALLPAALYYISIFTQIDFIARRDNIASIEDEERAPVATILRRGWIAVIAFAVLLVLIFQFRMRAEAAAVWTVFAISALGIGANAAGLGGLSARGLLTSVISTGRTTCDVLLITAAAGMIIGLLSVTGLGFALSYFLMDFGQGNLFGLLVLTGLVAIILGLGLPTSGVYLLLASLAAPALVQLGVPDLPAHMFVFYYGMLSMITPPIAMAAFAAASISGASQIQTGLQSFRFGWIAYLLPFLFIYKPAILMQGSIWDVSYVFVSAVAALVLITGSIVGHARVPLSWAMRVLWGCLGLAMMAPLHEFAGWSGEYVVSALGLLVLAAPMLRTGAAKASA